MTLTATTPGGDELLLRPLRRSDREEYEAVRRANAPWLRPWDATSPVPGEARPFNDLVAQYDELGRRGEALPFVIEFAGALVGQLNLNGIVFGSFRNVSAGYWVSRAVAGRGFTPTALAAAGDYAFSVLGLHRLEVNIRPENAASLAVVRKLGLRDEGLRQRMLHIDGAWRDHRSFAITTEELGSTRLIDRLNHQ